MPAKKKKKQTTPVQRKSKHVTKCGLLRMRLVP